MDKPVIDGRDDWSWSRGNVRADEILDVDSFRKVGRVPFDVGQDFAGLQLLQCPDFPCRRSHVGVESALAVEV